MSSVSRALVPRSRPVEEGPIDRQTPRDRVERAQTVRLTLGNVVLSNAMWFHFLVKYKTRDWNWSEIGRRLEVTRLVHCATYYC